MALSAQQFVESLSKHGIMSAADLGTLRESLSAAEMQADATALAKRLVQQGKLTKFQAANVYQGHGRGLIFGEYVVLDTLGAGGMGQVYRAQHRRMKRLVALKVLPPQSVNS